jgi:hypothetical protein
MKARTTGLELTFASALDGAAARPEAFTVNVWDLKRSSDYGSNRLNTRDLGVSRVTFSDDGRTALLQAPDLAPTWVVEVAHDVPAADGTAFDGVVQGTIYALEDGSPARGSRGRHQARVLGSAGDTHSFTTDSPRAPRPRA